MEALPPPPYPQLLDEVAVGYPGLILCGHCRQWNTKFAFDCCHCGGVIDGGELHDNNNNDSNSSNVAGSCIAPRPTSVVCNYDGDQLFSLAGENLLFDRLYPAGWKCCGCRGYNMDLSRRNHLGLPHGPQQLAGDPGRWICASPQHYTAQYNRPDYQKTHPPEFCPSCYAVNRYEDPLVYMGGPPPHAAPTDSSLQLVTYGPLHLHKRFLQNKAAATTDPAVATDPIADTDDWPHGPATRMRDALAYIATWLAALWEESAPTVTETTSTVPAAVSTASLVKMMEHASHEEQKLQVLPSQQSAYSSPTSEEDMRPTKKRKTRGPQPPIRPKPPNRPKSPKGFHQTGRDSRSRPGKQSPADYQSSEPKDCARTTTPGDGEDDSVLDCIFVAPQRP